MTFDNTTQTSVTITKSGSDWPFTVASGSVPAGRTLTPQYNSSVPANTHSYTASAQNASSVSGDIDIQGSETP
ncbi:MAG: hypothetical protein JSV80_11380 [Acidobacteriota bacterium]|nr:MAG: hypothetical protein JSV80_11380 [Acidobacteriota bacterium]